jgi:hypothetical protein
MAGGRRAHDDERISGAFYIGRGTFRMETLEGGVVSAPLIGALTPAKGIGYLPEYSDESSDETFARAGEETPQSDWLLTEPDHQPRRVLATSRSLVSLVAVLAFISGALVTAVLFTTKHSPLPVATPTPTPAATVPPVAASPTLLEAPPTITAPVLPAEPEAPPPPSPAMSPPPKVTAPAVVAKPFRKALATKERDREKAALARFPKMPASPPRASWVDPFAD